MVQVQPRRKSGTSQERRVRVWKSSGKFYIFTNSQSTAPADVMEESFRQHFTGESTAHPCPLHGGILLGKHQETNQGEVEAPFPPSRPACNACSNSWSSICPSPSRSNLDSMLKLEMFIRWGTGLAYIYIYSLYSCIRFFCNRTPLRG